ncbi:MAG: hypothetical protein ACOC6I_02770 [Candidatus Bipolaricaulota bacterium]
MKRIFPVLLILLVSVSVIAAAGSVEVGLKANTDLDIATFTNFYFNDNFSLGASLASEIQTSSNTLSLKHAQVSGKYHVPSIRRNLSLFGGGGLRMGLGGSSNQISSVFIFGIRINSSYGLNLIGEVNLVSPISNLSDYKLEPWFGLGFRF